MALAVTIVIFGALALILVLGVLISLPRRYLGRETPRERDLKAFMEDEHHADRH